MSRSRIGPLWVDCYRHFVKPQSTLWRRYITLCLPISRRSSIAPFSSTIGVSRIPFSTRFDTTIATSQSKLCFRPFSTTAYFSDRYQNNPMATARKIQLSIADSGIFSVGIREDAARTASEVLQEDLEKHHAYFNDMGFHNHIPHHILTIYALGASPDEIKTAYARGKSYQRPVLPSTESVIQLLHEKAQFKKCLGDEKHYPNFLAFFQQEIEKKGVESVLNEYLFSGEECAETMLVRLFAGLFHPVIYLGFGIEFNQPAIIAEALAQTATHDDWFGALFLLPAEKAAGGIGKPGKKTLLEILEEIRADTKVVNSVQWPDGNKIRDGVLKRAPDEMIEHAAKFTVSPDQLEEKLAEMINTVVYYTSAAQRPSKQIKFDFFFIHSLNASIFFSKILILPFIDVRTRARLLEWKGRMDLLVYVSRGAPDLLLNEVTEYQASKDWNTIFHLSNTHARDDGHLSKLTRAVANGEKVCHPFEAKAKEHGLSITGDMWLKIGNMVIDSTADTHPEWVRSTGFDEAWTEFENRPRL